MESLRNKKKKKREKEREKENTGENSGVTSKMAIDRTLEDRIYSRILRGEFVEWYPYFFLFREITLFLFSLFCLVIVLL